eukprot:CAMPEP_0197034252 /NCGR_PEP_ID=MMETSP1384-20130603/12414_1 /TAXON_ID=29189 /ORGANISM="Ammonia sp." /LENGTH=470 /DNA_ID=CAMNT_0042464155 /DNA_START=23 /DNA_END=1435 /DNA_ORIENTATION=+
MADDKPRKKVLVSGCFDLLHSGHVRFFEEASKLGDLYVCVGTDKNVEMLKHHKTMFPDPERLYLVQSIKYVHHARHSSGTGDLDFEPDLDDIKPDIFFVNEDGDRPPKRAVCAKRGIEFVVAKRTPAKGLKKRSSTQLKLDLKQIAEAKRLEDDDMDMSSDDGDRKESKETLKQFTNRVIRELKDIRQDVFKLEQQKQSGVKDDCKNNDDTLLFPWRLCLAGGWLDQPWVSKVMRGGVIVMNVDYHPEFDDRRGLGTSTRKTALRLWPNGKIPTNLDGVEAAKLLFGAENPPGTKYVSGSQDHFGLLLPGINRLDYKGDFWPNHVANMSDEAKQRNKNIDEIHEFVERVLWMVPVTTLRSADYNPLTKKNVTEENVEKLADASEKAWRGILNCDAEDFGAGLTETLKAWKLILPNTVPSSLDPIWQKFDKETHGCLFSGCGGGFLMVVSDKKPDDKAFQIKINTKEWWRN